VAFVAAVADRGAEVGDLDYRGAEVSDLGYKGRN